MTIRLASLLAMSVALFALPFVPGMVELFRPKDGRPLEIDETFTREPRYFGRGFREKLRPYLEELPPELPALLEIELRHPEILAIHQELHVPVGATETAVLAALGSADVQRGAHLGEVYVRGDARLRERVRLRALACDGNIWLGEGCTVERWIDAEEHVIAGPGCDLGFSTSAGRGLRIDAGCTFRRLWGLPIFVRVEEADAAPEEGEPPATIEEEVVWSRRRMSLPRGFRLDRDLVVHADVWIGAGSTIGGNIKAHGSIHLEQGVRVKGSLISRKDIRIAGGVRILGNVFAEGDLTIGPGTQVGRSRGIKTVYAAGKATVAPGATVRGWLIAEAGGRVELPRPGR